MNAAGPRPYKRKIKNVIIHWPMQREFSFVLIGLIMIASIAAGFVIHETVTEAAMGGGFRFGKISPDEIIMELHDTLILRVTCVLALTMVVTGVFAIFFLHRVAGPLYRFQNTLARLNKGEVPPKINLREGDFFQPVADELNTLIERLSKQQNQT